MVIEAIRLGIRPVSEDNVFWSVSTCVVSVFNRDWIDREEESWDWNWGRELWIRVWISSYP